MLIELGMLIRNIFSVDADMSGTSPTMICMYDNMSHLFVAHESCGHKRLRLTTGPSQRRRSGRGGLARYVCRLYIPEANTSIARVNLQYISALHPCWASAP